MRNTFLLFFYIRVFGSKLNFKNSVGKSKTLKKRGVPENDSGEIGPIVIKGNSLVPREL